MPEMLRFPIRGQKLSMAASVIRSLVNRTTSFQTIEIVETEAFGKSLLLDGHIQLTEFDEHAYHEALVAIPAMALSARERALVVGGGDGGAARELLSAGFQHVDVVEIDRGVVDACAEALPTVGNGALQDPRVSLHIADAFPFVRMATPGYDLIVLDSTDTYEDEEGALSEMLFTKEFYDDCARVLKQTGLVVTQADNPIFCPYSRENILKQLALSFPQTGAYNAIVPSFGGMSAYAWASKGATLPGPFQPEGRFRYLTAATYALAFARLSFG